MELQQDGESAHEGPGQQEDKQDQFQPPTSTQFQAPGPNVPGWNPNQAAGQQYVQHPFPPGAPPQWHPGMPYPPYGPYPQQWQPVMAYPPRGRSRVAQNLVICFGALMIAVIVFVGVSVTAFTSQGTRAAASGNSQANGADGNNASAGNTPTGTQTAQVGSAITLAGVSPGEQVTVTVTKVYPGAQAVDQYSEPPAGDRLFAVAFQLKNTGSVGYSDAPSNSAIVFDSSGKSYLTQLDDVSECPSFQTVVDIPVGSTSVGCIAYEVPNDARITKIQVILDSGYGPQTGDWKIGKSQQWAP
jgi:hypothetical protein